MTSSKSARRARRAERRRPEPRTEPVPRLRTADWDATTITFGGASDIGLPDGGPPATELDRQEAIAAEWHARQQAGRSELEQAPPGYGPAPTGPMRALARPAVSIGDALTRDDTWGPRLAPLPCGHCGTPPPVPDGILERTRIIGHVNWLARRDGWKYDVDLTWTCPDCQQGEAWKARQGQLELHRSGEYCDRHDLPRSAFPEDEYRCTCPGAVLAVDVMLASEDYLGSGRGRHAAGRR